MLEFVFKGENNSENYPLVVFLNEKGDSDIKRISGLNESEKKDLQQWFKCGVKIKENSCEKFICGGRVLLVVPYPEKRDAVSLRRTAEAVYREACRFPVIEVTWDVCDEAGNQNFAADFALAMEYAAYRFDKYNTKKKADEFPLLESVVLPLAKTPRNWRRVTALANAVRYARDLGNEPSNILTPETFALDIKRLEYLGIKVDLLDWKYICQNRMGLIEAVAKGSANKPYVAVMQWRGKPKQDEWDLGLVGKGVTFDSGGISLKTGAQLMGEKKDMCGAAAIVAAMKAAALQKCPVNLVAVLPLVENMPAGNACKPDDIVASYSGQTVEIVNTDAEGRLILADALWFIQEKYKVKTIIDLATLTGSTAYIFGGLYAGLLCNDASLASRLKEASAQTGEKLWELPLDEDISRFLDSEVADMKNTGKREAGSTQAACFLQRYIQNGVCWAHIDIAGCEADDKGMATGYGVLLLERICAAVSGSGNLI